MMAIYFAVFLLVLFQSVCYNFADLTNSQLHYPHSLFLDPQEHFQVFWKYDDNTITFELWVQTLGYVGFGLSPNGGMAGSDMVIGWVQDDEVVLNVSISLIICGKSCRNYMSGYYNLKCLPMNYP